MNDPGNRSHLRFTIGDVARRIGLTCFWIQAVFLTFYNAFWFADAYFGSNRMAKERLGISTSNWHLIAYEDFSTWGGTDVTWTYALTWPQAQALRARCRETNRTRAFLGGRIAEVFPSGARAGGHPLVGPDAGCTVAQWSGPKNDADLFLVLDDNIAQLQYGSL